MAQVQRGNKIFTNPDADSNATSSAPDGDLDAAYALLLAGQRWQQQAYTERGVKVTYAMTQCHGNCFAAHAIPVHPPCSSIVTRWHSLA